METDRLGLRISTASAQAAAAYREGTELLLSGFPGADAAFERALGFDARLALAHVALARHAQVYGRVAQVRESLAKARECAAAGSARERSHVEIHGMVMEGAPARALEALLRHVQEWPRDAMVLAMALGAFGLYAFSGRADHDAARLALCERLAPQYGEDWWFLTHLGWSQTEAGHLDGGLDNTRRALELRPRNAHAAHALAHWHAERGDAAGGAAFVDGWLPQYERAGMLYAHLAWHRALWHLEAGELAEALALYGAALRPAASLAPPINVISDCASLLWRISMREGFRRQAIAWQEVGDFARERYGGPSPHFIEWHVALALNAGADRTAVHRRLQAVRSREEAGVLPTGGTLAAVCEAFAAFAEGRYKDVVSALERVEHDTARLGGSGAQRRIIRETLETARQRARAGEARR